MKIRRKFSPKRVALVLFGFFVIPLLLIAADHVMENLTNYRDLNPQWIREGKNFIFLRWYWKKGISNGLLELRAASRDGGQGEVLHSFDSRFSIYGFRFMKPSEDGAYLFLRMSCEDPASPFHLRDFLYSIPLKHAGETKIWELHKEAPDDIIMAYAEGTALVRRIGNNSHNRLLFTDFGETHVYSEFAYPSECACIAACLFDHGKQAFAVISDDRPGKNEHKLYMLNRDGAEGKCCAIFSNALIAPRYLSDRKKFIAIGRENECFIVLDMVSGKSRKVPMPARSRGLVFDFSLTSSGECVLHTTDSGIYRINLESEEIRRMEFPFVPVPCAVEGPEDGNILVSSGDAIYRSDREGAHVQKVTRSSSKSILENQRFYRWYRMMRERVFLVLCRTILGPDSCEDHHGD